jgi:hypothetical protein
VLCSSLVMPHMICDFLMVVEGAELISIVVFACAFIQVVFMAMR